MSQTGKIKFYDFSRGFGFIVPDNGDKDIYFNKAALPLDRRYDPVQDDVVQYDIRSAQKGPMAVRVQQVT